VTLIGGHTADNLGVALPMAVNLGTEVVYAPDQSDVVTLRSEDVAGVAQVSVSTLDDAGIDHVDPPWARYVGAVVAHLRPVLGGAGTISTTLPLGAGLASSAALEVSVALALGFRGDALALARLCQQVEHTATGVPTGLIDPVTIAVGVEGCAMLIDFSDLATRPVPIPGEAEIVIVHSGTARRLEDTAYAERRAECEAAALELGPLGQARSSAISQLRDNVIRRRARHVVSECDRVRRFVAALDAGDLPEAGREMTESHRSVASDYEASTPALDAVVDHLVSMPGVHGARLTGAGFGGCVVALASAGAVDCSAFVTRAWSVGAAAGATVAQIE
jgi:galactokinase